MLAFLAKKSEKDEGLDESPGGKEDKKKHEDMKVITELEDRDDFRQIWVVSLDDEKPRRLTTEPWVYEDPAWSPDGRFLAFTYDEKGTRGVSEDSHVGIMPAEGGDIRRITGDDIFAGAPSWSRDGKRIAYFRDRDVEYGAYLNVKDLYVYDLEKETHTNVTLGVESPAVGGSGSIPHHAAVWSADDSSLYLLGAKGPAQNVYRVVVPEGGASSGGIRSGMIPITEQKGEIYAPTFSKDGSVMAFVMGSFSRVVEVYASTVDRFAPKRLTDTMKPLEKLGFREPETLRFDSLDGTPLEAFLFYPDNFEKGNPVPLVVDIHGGPASRWGAQVPRYAPWRLYNAHGMAVLLVNPRGSTGYGAEFQRGNFKGFGRGDLVDIISGVDHVIGMGVADPERLGVTGYSYGGFMTNNIITRTKRFKAAVSIAGGANYISCYCQANPILPGVFYDGPPWGESSRLYFEHSPIVRAGNVTTPTLIMHGEKDGAVDKSQSIEFFRALREAGVETELVLYPREAHSIYEPVHWRDYMKRSVEWFRKHLLGEEPEA